jgi:protein-tyrosine phosphatase
VAPYVDIHCHILPGVDDGVADLREAVALATYAEAGGTHTIVATPHIRDDVVLDISSIALRVAEVNDELAANGLAVRIVPGGEAAPERVGALSEAELRAISLGGNGVHILLEAPYRKKADLFASVARALLARGYIPVVAHPERSPGLETAVLRQLAGSGARIQVTAASLLGSFGRGVRRKAHELLGAGLIDIVASDAHGVDRRLAAFAALPERFEAHAEQIAACMTSKPAALLAATD